ncbi:ABC transporter permease [Pectinatus frisingensis]|uniref:ABC transporter permease n=1 Tax=Pectinatus frisingensis TaxID=865 RepID=UPI0018C7616C|nr:ABC transporter permease [Pectinatus frisingensis]
MAFLIWQSLLHRKLQNMAIVFSIAIGVGIVFCIIPIFSGVSKGMDLSRQRMGADIVVVPGNAVMEEPSLILFSGAPVNIYMPENITDTIRKIPGVSNATSQFFTHTLTADCCSVGDSIRLIGYDPSSDWIISPWLKSVRPDGLQSDEVIIGAKVQNIFGDKISILGQMFKIAAVLEETGTSMDYSILTNIDEARNLVTSNPQLKIALKDVGPTDKLISAVMVKTTEGANLENIVEKIQETGYVHPIVASEVKKHINDQFNLLLYLLGGTGILIVLLSIFQLFSRFYTLTWERQTEWGLYLALGAWARDIAVIVISEAICVVLAGVVIGLFAGGGLYWTGLQLLKAHQSFPFVNPSGIFFTILSLAMLVVFSCIGALAAWIPAYQGSHIEPSTIMTRGEFD